MYASDVVVAEERTVELIDMGDDIVEVIDVTIADPIEVGVIGPQGPPGSSVATYVHDQAIPAATWTIVHNLGYPPNVTVVDSSGREVVGDVTYPIPNTTVEIEFSSAFGGKAYLS